MVIGSTGKRLRTMMEFKAWIERLLNHRRVFEVVRVRRGERNSRTAILTKMAIKHPILMGIS
jgi:hypothetical protein